MKQTTTTEATVTTIHDMSDDQLDSHLDSLVSRYGMATDPARQTDLAMELLAARDEQKRRKAPTTLETQAICMLAGQAPDATTTLAQRLDAAHASRRPEPVFRPGSLYGGLRGVR